MHEGCGYTVLEGHTQVLQVTSPGTCTDISHRDSQSGPVSVSVHVPVTVHTVHHPNHQAAWVWDDVAARVEPDLVHIITYTHCLVVG